MAIRTPNIDLGHLDPNAHATSSLEASDLTTPLRGGEFKLLFVYSPPRTSSNALSDLKSAMACRTTTQYRRFRALYPSAHATSNLATMQRDG